MTITPPNYANGKGAIVLLGQRTDNDFVMTVGKKKKIARRKRLKDSKKVKSQVVILNRAQGCIPRYSWT
jgi:hypothetical protein